MSRMLQLNGFDWVEDVGGPAQRIRLDRDREASHDLNRLLDEPGPGPRVLAALTENMYLGNGPVRCLPGRTDALKCVHGCRCGRRYQSWALIGLIELRFEASRPLSLRTLISRHFAEGGRLHGQCVP